MLKWWFFAKSGHTDLERLDECVEEDSNADASPEQLDQPSGSEEFEEADGDHLRGVDDAADDRDEVESVPRIFEVVLKRGWKSFF